MNGWTADERLCFSPHDILINLPFYIECTSNLVNFLHTSPILWSRFENSLAHILLPSPLLEINTEQEKELVFSKMGKQVKNVNIRIKKLESNHSFYCFSYSVKISKKFNCLYKRSKK